MYQAVSQERKASFLSSHRRLLESVCERNKSLIATVPSHMVSLKLKKDLLDKNKTMLTRSIHTQLYCKQKSEWTVEKIIRTVNR